MNTLHLRNRLSFWLWTSLLLVTGFMALPAAELQQIDGAGLLDISGTEGFYGTIGGVDFINSGLSSVSNPDVFLSTSKPGNSAGGVAKAFNTNANSIDSEWATTLNKSEAITFGSLSGSRVGNDSAGYFYSFFLDTNEPNNATDDFVTIDHLEIRASASDTNTMDYDNPNTSDLGDTLIYAMDDGITDYSVRTRPASGGGQTGDMLFFVPDSYFDGIGNDHFIYIYLELSENQGKSAIGLAEDFFVAEEELPSPPSIPEPASILLVSVALLSSGTLMRRKKQ